MDLGLEDYRRDLSKYLKENPILEKVPRGLQAIVSPDKGMPEGTIFVLKQLTSKNKQTLRNRLYPYVVVYVDQDGNLVYPITEAKRLLEHIRLITKGKKEPQENLVQRFRQLSKDGAEMRHYSGLLEAAIKHLVEEDQQSTLGALFGTGGVNLFDKKVENLDDFELICFFVVLAEGER